MQKISTRVAMLVIVGALSAVPPAFAAPNGNHPNTLDCTVPGNNPLCPPFGNKTPGGNGGPPSASSSSSYYRGNGSSSSYKGDQNGNNGGQYNNGDQNGKYDRNGNDNNGPPSGSFNFSKHDRDQFHRRFHNFNFGDFSFFFTPNFSITIGSDVPSLYHHHLRPVPYSIYHYYPWFRGYLYFVDRRGDFVIVSPRTYRIVAVL